MTDHCRWNAGSIAIHWATAVCVIALVWTGWQMNSHGISIAYRTSVLQWHASLGTLVFLVTIIRIALRLFTKRPPFHIGQLRRISSVAIQSSLYLVLLSLIATGFLAASPRPFAPPAEVFGIWSVPRVSVIPTDFVSRAGAIHAALDWVLLGLIAVHVAGALYGSLFRRDGTVSRMLPTFRRF